MGMFAFRLTLLLYPLIIVTLVDSATVLDNSSDPWRDLVLNEDKEIQSQQSPPLSRRITPKSVFIAPTFSKCAQGTLLDEMGKCIKVVRIDESANQALQLAALEQKLNSIFQLSKQKDATSESPSRLQLGTNTTASITTTPASATTIEVSSNSTTVAAATAAEDQPNTSIENMSGPLQLSIPIYSKNSSENTEEGFFSFPRNETQFNLNPELETTTIDLNDTEISSDLPSDLFYGSETTASVGDPAYTTTYDEGSTSDNSSPATESEFVTEMAESTTTTTTTTAADFASPSTEGKVSVVRRFQAYRPEVEEDRGRRPIIVTRYVTPAAPSGSTLSQHSPRNPPLFHTHSINSNSESTSAKQQGIPAAGVIYRYPQTDQAASSSRLPVRFPESSTGYDTRPREPTASSLRLTNSADVASINKDSDISDSNISSSSISSSNSIILDSITNSKSSVYRKLPSNGRTRPKCDPATGYDCDPAKVNPLAPPEKMSYLTYVNRAPITTVIRFPGQYSKSTSTSVVRFPPGQKHAADEDTAEDSAVVFPEVGLTSRFWDSSRYPPSTYWNQWDPAKAHYVRIWPNNVATAPNYNLADFSYGYSSQVDDYSR